MEIQVVCCCEDDAKYQSRSVVGESVTKRAVRRCLMGFALLGPSLALAGCSGDSFSEAKLFPTTPRFFTSTLSTSNVKATGDLNLSGPVAPEEYVDAAGRCAAGPETTAAAPAAPAPGAQPSAAPQPEGSEGLLPGGVALGMTECQVVRHAGQASQVNIGAGEGGGRKVVLTFLSGPWPGIYTFADGRLKIVERAPTPEPAKPRHKAKPKKPTRQS